MTELEVLLRIYGYLDEEVNLLKKNIFNFENNN